MEGLIRYFMHATQDIDWHDAQHALWRDETARSSISHGLVSKIKPNLPIFGIYNELSCIMVNKGRIHIELRYFLDIF